MNNKKPTRIGFIILCHSHLDRVVQLTKMLVNNGQNDVAIHIDKNVADANYRFLCEQLENDIGNNVFLADRVHCEWGRFSLVEATLNSAEKLFNSGNELSHVMLLSGADLPVRPLAEFGDFLSAHPNTDFIESVPVSKKWVHGGLGGERYRFYFPLSYVKHKKLFDILVEIQRLAGVNRKLPLKSEYHMGSQWWCITRTSLEKIVNHVEAKSIRSFFKKTWIPDESYFQTLIREIDRNSEIVSSIPTFYRFDRDGRPYVFYDDHAESIKNLSSYFIRKTSPSAKKLYVWADKQAVAEADSTVERSNDKLHKKIQFLESRQTNSKKYGSVISTFDCHFEPQFRAHAVVFGYDEKLVRDFLSGFVDADSHTIHPMPFLNKKIDFSATIVAEIPYDKNDTGARDHAPLRFLSALIEAGAPMPIFGLTPNQNHFIEEKIWSSVTAQIVFLKNSWLVELISFVKREGLTLDENADKETILQQARDLFQTEASFAKHLAQLGQQAIIVDIMSDRDSSEEKFSCAGIHLKNKVLNFASLGSASLDAPWKRNVCQFLNENEFSLTLREDVT